MKILGISAYYHDSAAALLVDGEIIAAAQEERFSRKKHDPEFPARAVQWCLSEAGITDAELDYVGFYDKPLLKFDRLLQTYLAVAPRGFWSFTKAIPVWLHQKLHLPREMRRHLPGYRKRFVFTEHHESHAASAFFPSPFEEAAILTVDGVGEWATASLGVGQGNRIQLQGQLRFPHSLGLLYSAFTSYCGFRVNSGEYKLMGLAPYGEPRFVDVILRELIDLKPDGSFRMDQRYFNYCSGLTMTSRRFHRLFGARPRRSHEKISERHMDIAASIQKVTEEILLRMVRHLHSMTGVSNLCLAGGVALNCVANRRLQREGPFENLWIQPAAGDAGGALGVTQFIWHQLLGRERLPTSLDGMRGALLGPSFERDKIRESLTRWGVPFQEFEDEQPLCDFVAKEIADGKFVGWFQGRAEFGPRALGNRSILCDPRSPEAVRTINADIKYRESFRPFAPAVLQERVSDYFDVPRDWDSPYMLLVANVAESQRRTVQRLSTGLDRLHDVRSTVPAITHVDHSARVQTVDPLRHPRFHRLLSSFHALTACPVLLNTSFNTMDEPIVNSPEDAARTFSSSRLDLLVLGDFVLRKSELPTHFLFGEL
ncbi:MAG: carbamoyltransferase [Planctomycetaceae bacterium]|nr:carbamoyltransferase [Planctomycetaceae bacterium]